MLRGQIVDRLKEELARLIHSEYQLDLDLPSPLDPSIGPAIPTGGGGSSEHESAGPSMEHVIGRCKRCGKESELQEELCSECKWEIEVGMKPPLQQQEKSRHFWSLKR